MEEKAKKKFYQKWWFWVIVAFVVLGAISSGGDDATNPSAGYLESLPIQTADVLNGFKTEVIGEYAYIQADKQKTKELSEEEFYSYAKNVVGELEYNWFTIMFEDGTGIIFHNCFYPIASYGQIDEDGSLINIIGRISITEDAVTYVED